MDFKVSRVVFILHQCKSAISRRIQAEMKHSIQDALYIYDVSKLKQTAESLRRRNPKELQRGKILAQSCIVY